MSTNVASSAGLPVLRYLPALLLGASLLSAGSGCAPSEPASLVVTGARAWTAEPSQPWAEAVAVRGARILAVGAYDDIERLIGADTEVIALEGAFVAPGFIDTHVHLMDGGSGLASVQLRDAATPAEFATRIGAFASAIGPGEWIEHGTWNHENWGGELPHRDWIDDVTPDNPVAIQRLDGHMLLANSLALELAGIDRTTEDVEGGLVVRDDDGRPTGLLKDNAMLLVTGVIAPPGEEQLARRLEAAMAYLASNGVTTVHDMGRWRDLEVYRSAEAAGRLVTRIHSVLPLEDWEAVRDEIATRGTGSDWLRIGALKGFMDGSLGSHTAAFFESYTDQPDDRGLLINDPSDVRTWATGADAAGLQLAIHAIGDRAIRDLLDIYREVTRTNGARDRRLRIEHAQHIHPDDVARFAEQDVIASMQPYHAIDDGVWAEKVIGAERAKTTYAFRSLLESGARLAFGSDWYVAPASPIEGIYAAVTRRTLDGGHPGGWIPEQKISVLDALAAYTRDAAFAGFEEEAKGRLAPGLLADLVVLDRDPTEVAAEELGGIRVLRTIVDGRVVYSAD